MRYSVTSNLRTYQRIRKNMFSTENTLRILCIPQNFWPRKGPEYLYQLFDALLKQTTCEMKALQVYKFTFNNDFMMMYWKTLYGWISSLC